MDTNHYHSEVIHCTGVPGSSRDFFINCLAYHPGIHVNLGEHYLFNSPEEQMLFLSRNISAQIAAGVNNTVTTNRVKIPGSQMLEHCAGRGLLAIAASNNEDSFNKIYRLYPAARIIMTQATVEYLGVHADQHAEQSRLMELSIGLDSSYITSEAFLSWESFFSVWEWTIDMLKLDPVDDSIVSALKQFHSQYITTRSSAAPVQE
jgi:hypothetical protein